jgi:hypothetical protein
MTRSWIGQLSIGAALAACLVGLSPRTLSAQEGTKSWTKVMYLGGAVGVRGKSTTWDGTLTVSPQSIKLMRQFVDAPVFEIDPLSVTEVTYSGQKRVSDAAMVAGGLVGAVLVKSKDHYVTIDFKLPDGTQGAVLLRLDKEMAQEIVDTVRQVTHRKS